MVKSAGSAMLITSRIDPSPPEKNASPTSGGVNMCGIWHWTVMITASSSDIHLSLQFLQRVTRMYIFFC